MLKNIEYSKALVLLGISGVLMSAELQASPTSIHTEPLSRFGKGALEPQLPFKMQQPTEETAQHPFSVWGLANRSDFRDSFIISQQKGHSYTEVVGMDYKCTSKLKLGAFLIHNNISSTTPINTTKYHTYTNGIRPYATYYFMPWLSLNVVGGYSAGSIRTRKINSRNSTLILSKNKVNLWTVGSALTAVMSKNNFTGALRLGYTYNQIKENQYVESNGNRIDTNTTQRNNINSLAQLSYDWNTNHSFIKTFIPYLQAGIDYDVQASAIRSRVHGNLKRSKTGYTQGIGFKVALDKNLLMGAGYQRASGHSGLKINAYNINLRIPL